MHQEFLDNEGMLCAVAGHPILHSLSPPMHQAAFRALGLQGQYLRLASSTAASTLKMARAMGLRGFNVTSPFKEAMVECLDELEPQAQRLGAVNTVLLEPGGRTKGFNTDVEGVAGSLQASGCEISGQNAVVLGAGGGAKAAVLALLQEGAQVLLANRTPGRARQVAQELGCAWMPLEDLHHVLGDMQILVSAVSTDTRMIPPEALHGGLVILEGHYRSETSLMRDARRQGCKLLGGHSWLLYQGARAFELFTQHPAPLEAMMQALRASNHSPSSVLSVDQASRISFIGFMGSGKSTLAQELGSRLKRTVIDLDQMIEGRVGLSIFEIFETLGESAFRDLEAEALDLALDKACILACGGGVVLREDNRRSLRTRSLPIWLWASLRTSLERCGKGDSRPLMAGGTPDALSRLFQDRLALYGESSALVLDTESGDLNQLVERCIQECSILSLGETMTSQST